MRVAVLFHVASPGGLTRFTHALIDGMLAADETLEVDYYVADELLRAGRVPPFADPGRVRKIGLSDPLVVNSNLDNRTGPVHWINLKLAGHRRLHAAASTSYFLIWPRANRWLRGRAAKQWYEFSLSPETIEQLGRYDVVYLPFPFYLEPAPLTAPVVGTFHDVNHKHFPENFNRLLLRQIDRQLQYWTARVDAAVVSTRFIQEDVVRHYPRAAGHCSIVYVPPYSTLPIDEHVRADVLARFGLEESGYILYPSNMAFHKNLSALVAAADLMKQADGELRYPIVFTGFGTDRLGAGTARTLMELEAHLRSSALVIGSDVRGLGYVTDAEVDILTRSARMVVSTSLYEAGCGPALDAWQFGVPVAFSDIPPFVEQLDVLGVEAWVFDPRQPADIARVLTRALVEREEALAMAQRSRVAIGAHTWQKAGDAYLRIFRAAIERRRVDRRQAVAGSSGLEEGPLPQLGRDR